MVLKTPTATESTAPALNRREAYAWCRDFAKQSQENFTVISWMLPKHLRPHFASLYTYCRMTDDLGDEAEGDRLALLDEWEQDLERCFEGDASKPVFVALGATVRKYDIPIDPFARLVEANRIDQRIQRFATYDDLLDYCSYSATPVGHMVLYVLGYRNEGRQMLSDHTCIGLQLANFWQDVTVDWEDKGRVYLPQEDLDRFGVSEQMIADRRFTPAFRDLMHFQVERTQALFDKGKALEATLDRRSRLDIRLFRLGGEAVLDAIRAADYDVLTARPVIAKRKKAWMGISNGLRIKLGL